MTKLKVDKRIYFPDPEAFSLDGIVAMGDEISTDILLEAYSFGIFPWPHPELPCLWYSPEKRGVLEFEDFHISKSMRKHLAKRVHGVTFNQSFSEVIRKCAEVPRPDQDGTWITSPLLKAYEKFHEDGYAHSVEVWNQKQELVGGLYGVYVAGVFAGESMFFSETNASKVALIKLIEKLQENGLKWMDIQMLTPVTEAMGGVYVSKNQYFQMLAEAKAKAEPLKL